MALHDAMGKVQSNEELEVCHRTDRLPSTLDPSLLLLLPPSSLTITSSQLPLKLEGTSQEASMEHCLCTTRTQ